MTFRLEAARPDLYARLRRNVALHHGALVGQDILVSDAAALRRLQRSWPRLPGNVALNPAAAKFVPGGLVDGNYDNRDPASVGVNAACGGADVGMSLLAFGGAFCGLRRPVCRRRFGQRGSGWHAKARTSGVA